LIPYSPLYQERERERELQGEGLATQWKGGKDKPDPQQKPKTNLREKLANPSQDQETKGLKGKGAIEPREKGKQETEDEELKDQKRRGN
jgi:hypothetical protein